MTGAEPHPGRWAGLAVLSLSLLIVVMDMTILNVALPELGRDVRPTSIEMLWIVDVYALVVAGLLVSASALGDRIGRRRVLLGGYAVFAVASALVLVADSPGALVAVWALLGIGGAMIMPSTLSMIRTMFTDPRERGVALGVWAAMAGVGGAIGPIVGGALLEAFSWHAAFLVNVPFMLVALGAGLAFLPESRPDRPARIDAPAVLLSIAGAAALMYAIKSLGKHGLEPAPAGLAVLAIVLLAAFVRRSLRRPEPMLDVRLLAGRRFRGGVVAALSSMVAMGGLLLLGVQWLQLAEGLSPLQSGLAMLPMALTSVVSSLLVPRLAERFGQREAIAGGLLVAAVGMAVPVLAPGDLTVAALAVAFGVVGLGMGSLSVASGVIMSAAWRLVGEPAGTRAGDAPALSPAGLYSEEEEEGVFELDEPEELAAFAPSEDDEDEESADEVELEELSEEDEEDFSLAFSRLRFFVP